MTEELNQKIDWDYDFTEADYQDEVATLPPGVYPYEILKVEKTSFQGSAKLAPGPMARVTVELDGGDLGRGLATVSFVLNKQLLWKIAQFFVSCGLRKHGERGSMPWDEAVHEKGMCHVTTRKYTDKYGTEREVQDVDKWLDPDEAKKFSPAPKQQGFKIPQGY